MANCVEGASPVYQAGFPVGQGKSSPFTLLSEGYYTSVMQVYVDTYFAGDCTAAKGYAKDLEFPILAANGAIVKSDYSVPAPAGWLFSGGDASWSVYINGGARGTIDVVAGVPTDNTNIAWPLEMSGDVNLVMSTPTGSAGIVINSTSLIGMNFDLFWCCATTCCAAPIPPPRTGMQTFSNYTWSMVNSYGQVPKV